MVNRGLVGDPRRDRTLVTLIDKGLYDWKTEEQYRSVPEERAMRYAAVCTSMLLDQVEGLEESRTDFEPRVHNLEQVTSSLMGWQDKLNDKVNILSYDWNLNLKYRARVVNFEAKMLSFSLNESVLVHEDWSQLNSLVQESVELLSPGAIWAPSRSDCDCGRNSEVFNDQGASFFKRVCFDSR